LQNSNQSTRKRRRLSVVRSWAGPSPLIFWAIWWCETDRPARSESLMIFGDDMVLRR